MKLILINLYKQFVKMKRVEFYCVDENQKIKFKVTSNFFKTIEV